MKKRNIGMSTSASTAKGNILRLLASGDDLNQPVRKSAIGYAAFPECNFKTPQGAELQSPERQRLNHERMDQD